MLTSSQKSTQPSKLSGTVPTISMTHSSCLTYLSTLSQGLCYVAAVEYVKTVSRLTVVCAHFAEISVDSVDQEGLNSHVWSENASDWGVPIPSNWLVGSGLHYPTKWNYRILLHWCVIKFYNSEPSSNESTVLFIVHPTRSVLQFPLKHQKLRPWTPTGSTLQQSLRHHNSSGSQCTSYTGLTAAFKTVHTTMLLVTVNNQNIHVFVHHFP